MEENNYNRGAQSRLPLVGPGDQNLIRKETLAAGRFAPGLQAHSSIGKCYQDRAFVGLQRDVHGALPAVGLSAPQAADLARARHLYGDLRPLVAPVEDTQQSAVPQFDGAGSEVLVGELGGDTG